MDEELKSLIKVWISAIISISYCYYIPPRIKSGVPRLCSLCPVLALFLVLPLCFSSVHLSLITAFFLTWLANFKLILFSFDKGPLIPLPPSLSRFICFTCFPIKAQQNPKSQNHMPKLVFAIKVAIFGVLLHLYGYRKNLSPALLLAPYFVHLYLEIEIILSFIKNVVCIFLGCDLEPQSNKPYLATSLQDFWGRRWNLMVPAILRPAVYAPMRRVSERRMSSAWALFPGILAAFIVSGLVHELLFFYLTREMPTWEVTMFFVLHGVCTAVELAVKKKTTVIQRWQLSPVVSRLLTVGFVIVTGGWLFTPQLIRSGVIERFTNEALLVVDFISQKLFILLGIFITSIVVDFFKKKLFEFLAEILMNYG
ncbi:probable long-chain-alcohol O-fatty-acyltransferase 5 [Brassica napus]|uniref:(rape) hypothetical protein n=1 Tax=Brassica napus TaxID=3708 RepID=A0A816J6T8_BRANA|nr:probable long-chain-alcohol O-fatty-acyltransferase 5 [Brassica napus]CAF1760759.1 unnamed protein product [Brassica napus]